MRRYEVVFVLAPDLPDDEMEKTIETYKGTAEEVGAKVLDVEKWVRRQLAFPVKKYREGTYVFLTLEEEHGQAVAELERRFKVSDPVIRFLTIRVDGTNRRIEKQIARDEARRKKSSRKSEEGQPETQKAAEEAG